MRGMHRAGESSGSTRAGEAIAPLRGLLELSRLTHRQPTPLEALAAVASTVSDALGFATVLIHAYRAQDDEYEVVTVHGSDRAREVLLGQVTAAQAWSPLLDERFRRHGVYFIPAGAVERGEPVLAGYQSQPAGPQPDDEAAWRPGDAAFASLEGGGGRRYGIISVDEPLSGRRPKDRPARGCSGRWPPTLRWRSRARAR